MGVRDRISTIDEAADSLQEAVFAEGTLEPVEKRLCAIVAANMARDEQTLTKQIQQAKELGASEDEISGALSAAWMTAGSTQIYWAEDTFEQEIEHAWYKRRLPAASKAYGSFHDAVMEDGPLPEVFMEVLCVIVGSMDRCDHCTEAHIKQALDKGATKDQIAEALGVAWYIGGESQVGWIEETLDELLA